MKVLLRRNVKHLGQIGEVVEVKPGYARNYLVPCGLAIEPTDANLRAIEEEKQRYLEELAKQRKEIEARAQVLNGKEITIAARANEEGHLYGSVGPAQIAAALAEENLFVEPSEVLLHEPIRQLDKYDVELSFEQDVSATIHVWVVPAREILDDEPADEAGAEEAPTPSPADATPDDDAAAADSETSPAE